MFYVFDIDGTILDGSHKAGLVQHAKPGEPWPTQTDEAWEKWYEACADDKPIEPILELADSLDLVGHKVEFWTGRYEACRTHTEAWLKARGLPYAVVRMRPLDEREDADCEVKERFLARYGRPDMVFEDRQSVTDMWRRNGIICAKVAEGNY